jgi:hypothetical protein
MVTSVAISISTTTVSATHAPTVVWTATGTGVLRVLGPDNVVLPITVHNVGPHPISRVEIIAPSGWGRAPTIMMFKDNLVTLAPGNENIVTLKAGTVVRLHGDTTVRIPKDTLMIRLMHTDMWRERDNIIENKRRIRLLENAKVRARFADNTAIGLDNDDNIRLVLPDVVTLENGLVRLLANTIVVRVADNIVRLPKNTLVEPIAHRHTVLGHGLEITENVTLENEVTLTLTENRVRLVTDFLDAEFVTPPWFGTPTVLRIPVDENMQLWTPPTVRVPARTLVRMHTATRVTVLKHTDVIRESGENVTMTPATAAAAENRPINWTQAVGLSALPLGENVVWVGIGENRIAAGASLVFPFALTTDNVSENHTIFVRTTDTAGVAVMSKVTLVVDNAPPIVTVTVSPDWVRDNVPVTITVTSNEPLKRIENVLVAENMAPDNTSITMTPNVDNTIWTGTYTTGDNVLRDGTAIVRALRAVDLVGNVAPLTIGTFTVDRRPPPTPKLTLIRGFPADAPTTDPPFGLPGIQTRIATWTIENIAKDNYLTALVPQPGMRVRIRVGAVVHEIITPATGYYVHTITLTEGIQAVGIQYIDRAGNVGIENVENVTLDTTPPSISMISPAPGAIIRDNTPLFRLTIADVTLGVENLPWAFADNSGYQVLLRRDNDNALLGTLTPITPPTNPFFLFTFENQWPVDNALPMGWYNIFVQAGDNLQKDNTFFRFGIDVRAPPHGPLEDIARTAVNPLLHTTPVRPLIDDTTTLTLTGSGAYVGATVRVYLDGAAALETATVDAFGRWTVSVQVPEGDTVMVEVTLTDVAGNESPRVLYGFMLADKTIPRVDITAPPDGKTTDMATVILTAVITGDDWEANQDVKVRIEATALLAPVEFTATLDAGSRMELTRAIPLLEFVNTISVSAKDGAGNWSAVDTVRVTRAVVPWGTYAIILVIVALILAAIAIFRKK